MIRQKPLRILTIPEHRLCSWTFGELPEKSKEDQKSDAVFNQGKHHFTKKSEQTHLVIAYDGIKRDHKLYTASNLLSTILGDGMSSQLFNEIREKQGLAYTVYSFTDIFKKGALFGAYAAGSKEKSEQMKNSMLKIINQKKYTDNELKKAKNMTISSLKMMQDKNIELPIPQNIFVRNVVKLNRAKNPCWSNVRINSTMKKSFVE